MATAAAPGILTASADPDVARRAWPRWLALGLAMLVVAAVGLFWSAEGPRVLLGAIGAFLAARGVVLLRGGAAAGDGARTLGSAAVVVGLAGLAAALVPTALSGWVLLVAVPLLLLGGGAAQLMRGRNGRALLGGGALVTAALVAVGLAQSWDRATGLATVLTGLAVAVLAVPVLLGAAELRTTASRPAPPAPAGCGGCACGAGGCGGAALG